MSTWQNGQTPQTLKDRKLELQRLRRSRRNRVDYYPSAAAWAAIAPLCDGRTPISTLIDRLVLAGDPELRATIKGGAS